MLVQVQGLTKTYGTQTAVDHISFEAKPGEILGFLGPNGAGKSTTMKMLTGFVTPTDGNAMIGGYSVIQNSLAARKHIGYLPEHNPLYLQMYVKEYLSFVAQLHKLSSKQSRIADIIEQVGLQKEQHKIIGTLSKGYRQRVGLAQALIHDPAVLILDEPTSGLDTNQLVEIRSLIRQLGRDKTVLFSTHIMQEVQALCDRVVIINQGKIVADDPIDRLQDKVNGVYMLKLQIQEATDILTQIQQIEGVQSAVQVDQGKYDLYCTKEVDVRPTLFRMVADQGLTILEMYRETGNVEQVFRQLTKS